MASGEGCQGLQRDTKGQGVTPWPFCAANTEVCKVLSGHVRSWGGFARCFLISRSEAPSPCFSLIRASRGWSFPAPSPYCQLKEGMHKPGILQASLGLLEHKSSSACTKRMAVGWQSWSSIETVSGPQMKRSSLIYVARHLAASMEPSSSLRAGLWRQNLTSAAAGDDKLEKGQHEILFSARIQHRSSSLQKVHVSRLQSCGLVLHLEIFSQRP